MLDGGAYASSSLGGGGQRRPLRRRPVQGAERHARRRRGAHQQPAVRGHARLRRGAGVLRPRVADGRARPGRSGIDPVELRLRNALERGDVLPDRAGAQRHGPGGRVPAGGGRPSAAPPLAADVAGTDTWLAGAGRRRPHRRPIAGAPRGRLRGRVGRTCCSPRGSRTTPRPRVVLEDGAAIVTCRGGRGRPGLRHPRRADRPHAARRATSVVVAPAETATIGSAGSTSASRQTWMSGGAVERACQLVGDQVRARLARSLERRPVDSLAVTDDGRHRRPNGTVDIDGGRGGRRRALRGHRRARPPPDGAARRRRPGRLPT